MACGYDLAPNRPSSFPVVRRLRTNRVRARIISSRAPHGLQRPGRGL